MFDLDQIVGRQRRAGMHQIDHPAAQAEAGRQLHGAIQLDAFGLHAARREMAPGDVRVFGRHPHMAPARGVVRQGQLAGLRHRHAAMADIEIERRVELAVVEFHQHVGAGDAELSRAEGDERGDVEAAHADDAEAGNIGGEAELAAGVGEERRLRLDSGARQQRRGLLVEASLRHGEY